MYMLRDRIWKIFNVNNSNSDQESRDVDENTSESSNNETKNKKGLYKK